MTSKDRQLPLGEQRFRLASFNRRALLQIRIAFFFVTGKERERDSDRKLKGVWERERWHREVENSKRKKKRVWESGESRDGEAEKEWLNVKMK